MKRLVLPTVGACVAAWTMALPAAAQNNPAARLSLRGLDGVAISVQPIGPAAQKAGLSGKRLETAVEGRLRRAGVPLLSPDEQLERLRRPGLSIGVTTVGLDTDEYLYFIRVEFVQWVALLDDPTRLVSDAVPLPAATWSPPGVLGITPTASLEDDVKSAVLSMVDKFADAYRQANPRGGAR